MNGRPTIDGDRLLGRLAQLASIGATASGGVTRQAYGAMDVRARGTVERWMERAGLEVEVDGAANLVGRRPGRRPEAGWLATGSHLDTVVEAGPLDGAYGVVAAVEVADALHRSGTELDHGLIVVAFANEEGARGTDGMVGSRALVGDVMPVELAAKDDDGITLAQRLVDAGGGPSRLADAEWDLSTIATFVELHVEQGPVLDAAGEDLGVVAGITGRQAVDVELRGAANHAGTTPMDLRQDALVAGAEVVLVVEELARSGAVRVATCGHLEVEPNVRNVVPGTVALSIELRDHDLGRIDKAGALLREQVEALAERRGVEAELTWGQLVPPVASDPRVVEVLRAAAERSGRPWRELWSGAGHDAQILGTHVPMGMVFVPSTGGVSHAPSEATEPHHLVAGAQFLADALLDLDRASHRP